MTLLAAATLGDDIVHTPWLAQVLKVATTFGTGLLTGIAIGAAAAFIVGTGGLGAVVLGAVAGAVLGAGLDLLGRRAGARSLDDALTRPLFDAIDTLCPGVVKGRIVTGSPHPDAHVRRDLDHQAPQKAWHSAGNPPSAWPCSCRRIVAPRALLSSTTQPASPVGAGSGAFWGRGSSTKCNAGLRCPAAAARCASRRLSAA
jgi:hypothetical protein